MFCDVPTQLPLPGFPVPVQSLQELADAQRAFVAAFEYYKQLLSDQMPEADRA